MSCPVEATAPGRALGAAPIGCAAREDGGREARPDGDAAQIPSGVLGQDIAWRARLAGVAIDPGAHRTVADRSLDAPQLGVDVSARARSVRPERPPDATERQDSGEAFQTPLVVDDAPGVPLDIAELWRGLLSPAAPQP